MEQGLDPKFNWDMILRMLDNTWTNGNLITVGDAYPRVTITAVCLMMIYLPGGKISGIQVNYTTGGGSSP